MSRLPTSTMLLTLRVRIMSPTASLMKEVVRRGAVAGAGVISASLHASGSHAYCGGQH